MDLGGDPASLTLCSEDGAEVAIFWRVSPHPPRVSLAEGKPEPKQNPQARYLPESRCNCKCRDRGTC